MADAPLLTAVLHRLASLPTTAFAFFRSLPPPHPLDGSLALLHLLAPHPRHHPAAHSLLGDLSLRHPLLLPSILAEPHLPSWLLHALDYSGRPHDVVVAISRAHLAATMSPLLFPAAKTLFLSHFPPSLSPTPRLQLRRATATATAAGGDAAASGTTARERRLAKVREGRRRREYDRQHTYPGWARVLENACRDDEEMRAILGDSIGNPELMKQRIQERVRKKGREGFNRPKTGSVAAFKVSFRDFNPLNAFIWFEIFGEPTDRDVDLLGGVIQAWYVMGRLGAFNSSNLQLANSMLDFDPSYDSDEASAVMPSSFHDISDVEFQDSWGRVWVDLGTSDYLGLDVLLNCLTQLSSEHMGIKQVVFGGRKLGDWEEGMTSSDYGYKHFKI
ncbi:hypothetical protein ACQ4PT_010211 [Festuca glaucescens]